MAQAEAAAALVAAVEAEAVAPEAVGMADMDLAMAWVRA
jgi:hypothetical protein